jgi:uncharacterized radical SAM superfamily Fe-S cluster-containing enzyme
MRQAQARSVGAKLRPYLFYDSAVSICGTCLRRVEAKILIKDEKVYLEKWCAEHGRERVLIASDAAYYRKARELYIKPPEMPRQFNTEQRWGCPYDCGLCPGTHAAQLPDADRNHRSL